MPSHLYTSGNERYYDFVVGPVHFFVLNSNYQELDGTGSSSTQAQWLKQQLAASTSFWNIVYDHHPPYSSDSSHGSTAGMQWPFAAWGADAVISGHAHTYERILRDGIVYFVNGLGGAARYGFATPIAGSAVRYNAGWGAQKVTASATELVFEFYNVDGVLVDSYRLEILVPTAHTSPATGIGTTRATLNGMVSSNGGDTSVRFEFGLTTGYGSTANAAPSPLVAAAANVAVSATITGLVCGTTYHFRAIATNSAGSTPGSDGLFATAACPQTIAFGAAPSLVVGGSGTVSATATSGLPVIFNSLTSGVCTVVGNTATGVGAGVCTIAANQAGNANYSPAPQSVQSFSVGKANQAPLTASATPSSLIYGGTATLSTTGGSGTGLVGYAVTAGPCSAAGNKLTAIGVGSCTVTATKAGDGNYNDVSASLGVPVDKANQTIAFGAAPTVIVGGSGTVSATATSGLPVIFSSLTSGVCTVVGNTATGIGAGVCTIAANQEGNANYNPAPQSAQSFSVLQPVSIALSVAQMGTGAGMVTSNPPGILCAADCNERYAPGTIVTLIATPFAGSAFREWGGACTGTGGCTAVLSADKSTLATFDYIGSVRSHDYVQKAYVAFYGRPADPAGQAYWAGRMDAEGGSLSVIIEAFGDSDEFIRRYGGLSYPQLVTRIYQQALGRDPEQGGLDYYVGELQAGRRKLQSITLDVLNGAITAPDSTVVANKLDVAAHYSAKVAAGCPYGTEQDGVNALAGVTTDPASVTGAKAGIDARCGP